MGLFDNFSSIDYSGLQTIFDSAIGSMIDSDACTVPCTLEFGVTKYDDCNNCVYDPIGRKSSNVYEAGGPVPFPFGGLCPMCNGQGKKPVVSTENVKVIIVYNPKEFDKVLKGKWGGSGESGAPPTGSLFSPVWAV